MRYEDYLPKQVENDKRQFFGDEIIMVEELKNVKNYLNVYHNEDDLLIKSLMLASYDYILEKTGLTTEQFKKNIDSLKIAMYMIITQWYDNRGMENSQTRVNSAIDNILGLYRNNFVASEEVNI